MITQTPSPNKTMPTKRREPLRWLIPAALLLLFLSICCLGQVVIVILSPRNEASNLNLLSKDMADYSPWKILLKFPPIAPGAAAAQAADRATEAAQALLSPTPLVVAKVPTSEVIVIAAPQNAPTTTPGSALITPQPTVTPRPAALGPTATPVIGTAPPVATPVATLVAIVLTPTDTPRPPTLTNTPIAGDQPTRTNTPVPPAATNTPQPADTSTPTSVAHTPTRVVPSDTPVSPPSATDTPVSPPSATDTPVPPPSATDTPAPPHHTNTPVPPATKTPTPVTPTRTPTPVTPTPVTPTATYTPTPTVTPAPPTATDTPTVTPTVTPTSSPTNTPTPSCGVGTGSSLRIAKIANTYATAPNQQVTYTICIYNNTGTPVFIQDIQDTFPSEWSWVPFGNCGPTTATVGCVIPISNGGTVIWANPQPGSPPITIPDGQQLNLTVSGSYQSSAPGGLPWCNRYGSEFIVNVIGSPLIQTDPIDACVAVQ
jgi:hypothetical protein